LIKRIDAYIIKSFIGPFIITFFVTLFILVMQFFWLYMDELIGKGLGAIDILQLLSLMSTTLVPMALPLGILLASIMTFGNLGEHFELIAIKSSGISLIRFMQPLFILLSILSVGAFVFNNNVIPAANLKAFSLLYDMRNSKPTLNIKAGQFSKGLEGYTIRIGEKGNDGKTIKNVLIYDQSSGMGNDRVIVAESGEMIPSEDGHYLTFRLRNGCKYEEKLNTGGPAANEQTRMYFKQWDKIFDLSSFKLNRTNQDLFKGAYQMMNISQLNESIDSVKKYEIKIKQNIESFINPYLYIFNYKTSANYTRYYKQLATTTTKIKYSSSILSMMRDSIKNACLQQSLSNCRNIKGLLDINVSDASIQNDNLLKYKIEWHRKFTLSFACLLLFLIGAPLGSIIRKGGLGMPMLFSICFFLVFHIISIVGEKLSHSGALPPYAGMWLATSMLLPIALFLINKAKKDSQVFNLDTYKVFFKRIQQLFNKSK
jgi:lipopolysaccharide export system permease protein